MHKILFVDDEAPVRRAFEFLHGDFFEIEVAESADQALKRVASDQQIAIVVTDLKMPDKGGEELTRELRAQFPKKKIVINTANIDMQHLKKAINDASVDAFLEKVDHNPEAIQNVRSILARLLQEYRDNE